MITIWECSCGKYPIIKELKLIGYDIPWRHAIICCDRVYKTKLEDAIKIWNERRKSEENIRIDKKILCFK